RVQAISAKMKSRLQLRPISIPKSRPSLIEEPISVEWDHRRTMRSHRIPVAAGRLTNVALAVLLTLAFPTGWIAFELSGQPGRAILLVHAGAGVAIVLLVPWKSLIGRRGIRRQRAMRWASLVLGLGVVISLVFGFLHSAGRPSVGDLTAMDFHVGAASCVIPFFVWHVLARPVKL